MAAQSDKKKATKPAKETTKSSGQKATKSGNAGKSTKGQEQDGSVKNSK
jgi:hypothetical protein